MCPSEVFTMELLWTVLYAHCYGHCLEPGLFWCNQRLQNHEHPGYIIWDHQADEKVASMRCNISASQGITSRIIPRHSCTLRHKLDCSSASITNYHQKLPSPPSTLARVTTFCERTIDKEQDPRCVTVHEVFQVFLWIGFGNSCWIIVTTWAKY